MPRSQRDTVACSTPRREARSDCLRLKTKRRRRTSAGHGVIASVPCPPPSLVSLDDSSSSDTSAELSASPELLALTKGRYLEELNNRYNNGKATFNDLHRNLISIVLDEAYDIVDMFGMSNFKMDYDNRSLKVKAGENRWIVFQLSPTYVVDDNDDIIETIR